jgi:ZipA, C-terminal FtsZ-binding domain
MICFSSRPHSIDAVCDALNIEKQPRPKPIYSFFPIYSPFKLQDDDGFDLGEDNAITSLYIKDGALRFEMSAVLRPGRFLGSHYIAFSIPSRTFIVTLDRVTEGIRSARKVKKAARALKIASDRRLDNQERKQMRLINFDRAEDALLARQEERMKNAAAGKRSKMKNFFSRFVDGYLQAERDDSKKQRLTTAIRDFFGRQGI